MVYQRPQDLAYPKVWCRFRVKNPNSGVEMKFKVQDLSEDMHEDAMKLLSKYFMRDEPPCKHIEIQKYPSAVAELEKLWSKTLKDKLSLVCLEDVEGSKNIVGLNVLTVVQKDDSDEPFQTDDKIWAKLFGAVDLVTRSVNIFERYDVDKYLTAYGLVVRPRIQGHEHRERDIEGEPKGARRANNLISQTFRGILIGRRGAAAAPRNCGCRPTSLNLRERNDIGDALGTFVGFRALWN
ncbi:hypothetical protein EVAR_68738_1 [Eumeta japonica]|uniref:Uncharacterized protein n=1 Tax=Eumeta variegata TaxID=151549 RepID=A0A4C1ZL86_EUMVA|nr:hypothetical protein EVAR_68738_1 [Eumeta japonica]